MVPLIGMAWQWRHRLAEDGLVAITPAELEIIDRRREALASESANLCGRPCEGAEWGGFAGNTLPTPYVQSAAVSDGGVAPVGLGASIHYSTQPPFKL